MRTNQVYNTTVHLTPFSGPWGVDVKFNVMIHQHSWDCWVDQGFVIRPPPEYNAFPWRWRKPQRREECGPGGENVQFSRGDAGNPDVRLRWGEEPSPPPAPLLHLPRCRSLEARPASSCLPFSRPGDFHQGSGASSLSSSPPSSSRWTLASPSTDRGRQSFSKEVLSESQGYTEDRVAGGLDRYQRKEPMFLINSTAIVTSASFV